MRSIGLLLLFCLIGCGGSSTTILVSVTADPKPDQIFVSVYDPHGDLVLRRPSDRAAPLPGQLLIEGLPSTAEEIRVVLAGTGALGSSLGGGAITIVPNGQVQLAIDLAADTPDTDGDGVPDALDDCPTVADREQVNIAGHGPGVACLGGDAGSENGDGGTISDGGSVDAACIPGCGPVGHCGGACSVTFAPMASYAIGTSSTDIGIGDLDGDGRPEVVISSSDGVRLFRNRGNGTLDTPTLLSGGVSPYGIGVADFDRDGDLDLAVLYTGSDTVGIFLNDGKANFAVATAFSAGSSPQKIAVGDLDGDGDPDLVVTSPSANLAVLLNAGAGAFPKVTMVATGGLPSGVAVADFDRDGKLDVAVASGNDLFISLGGNGDGTFRAPVTLAAGSGPNSATTGDVDGDGFADAVLQDYQDGNASLVLGKGDGTFRAAMAVPTTTQPNAHNARLADLNDDGLLDIVCSGGPANAVGVALQKADHTFQPPALFPAGANVERVAPADLDGDGRIDLVVVNVDANTLGVLLNTSQ